MSDDRRPGTGAPANSCDGFTLVEIIVAVAIVAIMAAAITPLAYREITRAREEATLRELAALQQGLLEFYEDTGRFPSEGEGLAALLTDPGAGGWQGPYVGGDRGTPLIETTTDAWGETYQYDLSPATVPAGAADVIIASGGIDRAVTFGSLGATWTVAGDGDDLLSLVAVGPVNRDKLENCRSELAVIADAARRYFEDHAAFPATTADLTDAYLDAGIDGQTLMDPWQRLYVVLVDDTGVSPPDFIARSWGPDRANDAGGDDDISFNVSSLPPARKTTLYKLEIVQTALNLDSGLALSGAWTATDRAALSLAAGFDTDGWGRDFEVNVGSRAVFSAGADGDAATTDDNLPAGVGPG
jgi:general secretion pathway protein G